MNVPICSGSSACFPAAASARSKPADSLMHLNAAWAKSYITAVGGICGERVLLPQFYNFLTQHLVTGSSFLHQLMVIIKSSYGTSACINAMMCILMYPQCTGQSFTHSKVTFETLHHQNYDIIYMIQNPFMFKIKTYVHNQYI